MASNNSGLCQYFVSVTLAGYPMHKENRKNSQNNSLLGKTQGIWKFCQITGKTQGIWFAQVVISLIQNENIFQYL